MAGPSRARDLRTTSAWQRELRSSTPLVVGWLTACGWGLGRTGPLLWIASSVCSRSVPGRGCGRLSACQLLELQDLGELRDPDIVRRRQRTSPPIARSIDPYGQHPERARCFQLASGAVRHEKTLLR